MKIFYVLLVTLAAVCAIDVILYAFIGIAIFPRGVNNHMLASRVAIGAVAAISARMVSRHISKGRP